MKLNNILRYSIMSGLALVLFTPLIVTGSMYFPFITGKNFAFRILVEIIAGLWVILAWRDPSARPKKSLILWGATALVVISSLSTILGDNLYRSFWSNFERMDGLITQLHLFLYLIVVTGVINTRQHWYRFFNVSLIASVCVSIYATFQLFGWTAIHQGTVRIDSTLGNAAYLAVYLLFSLFISAYLAVVATKNNWTKALYWFLSAWFAVLLYYTQTRGTILGLIGGLFILGLLLAWKASGKIRKIAIGLSLSVLILVGGFLAVKNTSFVQNNQTLARFASISLTEKTTVSRFTIWQMSLKAVAEKPILGWGQENFVYVFSKYYEPSLWRQEPWFDRSHNVFLDWLVSTGILGLISYLFLFGASIYYLFKKIDQKNIKENEKNNQNANLEIFGLTLVISLLAAYLCHNFFVFDNLISYILFFSILGFIHTLVTEGEKTLGNDKKGGENSTWIVVLGTILVFLSVCYYINIKPVMASRGLIRAMVTSDAQAKFDQYQKVFKLNTFGSREALEQYLSDTVKILSRDNVDTSLKQQYGNLALEQIDQQMKKAGPDARPYIVVSTFMDNIGRFDDALMYLNKALIYAPKKQLVYFQLASTYLNKKDFANALSVSKKAVELDPTYPEASMMYALVAIYDKQIDLADKILADWHNEPNIIRDDRLIGAYTYAGRTDKVAEVLMWRVNNSEELIKTNPTDESNYLALADTWTKLGNKAKSDEALSRLAAILENKIKQSPEDQTKYLSLAETYYRLGDNAKVTETVNKIVSIYQAKVKSNPREINNYIVLSDIFTKAGRPDLARQIIESGVRANPSFRYQAAQILGGLPAPASSTAR